MSASDSATGRTDRTAVQKAALAVGIVFLAVGVLGFIPGITTNYDALQSIRMSPRPCCLAFFRCRSCTTSCTCCSALPVWSWLAV
jgi:hypothetical protein